ncbi:MAG: nucleotidyltransferase domain-containing protein [Spirochaetes bacterium]|nr:nucleotidyltransferase domain-containing protein [Spirochaetota bacterium]
MIKNTFGIEDTIINSLREIFLQYPEIEKVLIYGSRAKGSYSKGSDIDIVIIAPQMDFSHYLKLYAQLDELEIPYTLDVTKYELIGENIKSHIQRVGVEIYKHNYE